MIKNKKLSSAENPTSDEVAEFLGEIEMLKGVGRHNNIVCFYGCCTIRAPYLMIMEFVGRGDLVITYIYIYIYFNRFNINFIFIFINYVYSSANLPTYCASEFHKIQTEWPRPVRKSQPRERAIKTESKIY